MTTFFYTIKAMSKNLLKIHGLGLFSMLLVVAAAVLGADSSFAMAVTLVSGNTEKVNDDKGLATQMPGVGANTTEAVESGFSAEEIDEAIAQFRPFKTPLEYSIVMEAVQRPVEKYEVIHYRTGTTLFDVATVKNVTTADDSGNEMLYLTYGSDSGSYTAALNSKSDLRLFTESKVIHFPKGGTYTDTVTKKSGQLSFLVTKNDGSKVDLLLLNPVSVSSSHVRVTIASGSKAIIGVVAASESQMIVAPDNYEPVPTTVYLQKRISNIVMTDDWIKDKKKVAFSESDVRQNALYNFQVANEINDWLGVQSRFKVDVSNNHMNDEFVYTSEGVLRQIKMFYAYQDNNLKSTDLNAIAKIDFTKYADNNYAKAYCGKDFILALLNMDLTVHKEIKFENVDVAGMAIKSWKNNFGTIDFVYTPTLDLIGFSKYAAVIDIENAVHYVKRASKTDSVDMKQGTGEVREAKREIYSRIDAIALRGYNAILVGPSSEIASASGLLPNISTFAAAWNGLYSPNSDNANITSAASLTDKMVVYLTANAFGFSAGDLITYSASTTSWSAFSGEITA